MNTSTGSLLWIRRVTRIAINKHLFAICHKTDACWNEQASLGILNRAILIEDTMEDIAMKTFASLGMMLLAMALPAMVLPAMVLAGTGPALAESASPAPVDARVDKRITQMHQQLEITPAQQPAWDAFTQTMRENMTTIETANKERKAAVPTMSAPDNMRNFAQIERDRADGVQKLAASFQVLYDTMSDDQKKTADVMFRDYGERGVPRKKGSK